MPKAKKTTKSDSKIKKTTKAKKVVKKNTSKAPVKVKTTKSETVKTQKIQQTSKPKENKAEIIKDITNTNLNRKYQKFGLYFHIIFFLIINSIMFLVNVFSRTEIWFIYPLLGWGIILFVHFFMVFFMPTKLEQFEQKYVDKLVKETFEDSPKN